MAETPEPLGGCQCEWQAAKLEPTETAMEPELKPCPFCGGEAKLISCMGNRKDKGPPWYETLKRVVCVNRVCSGIGQPFETDGEAIKFWNTRAPTLAEALAVIDQAVIDAETVWVNTASSDADNDFHVAKIKNIRRVRTALAAMEGRK